MTELIARIASKTNFRFFTKSEENMEDKKMSNKLNKILAKINFRKNFYLIDKERDTNKNRFDDSFPIR